MSGRDKSMPTIELKTSNPAAAREAFERAVAEQKVPMDIALSQAMDMWVEAQRTKAWFEARRAAVDWVEFDRILAEGGGEEPQPWDRLPAGYVRR